MEVLTEMHLAGALRDAAKGACRDLTDASPRGAGAMIFRPNPKGEGRFYYRYMRPGHGRDTLLVGIYDPKGKSGFTLKDARKKCRGWMLLYQSGTKDIRAHVEAEERTKQLELSSDGADEEADPKKTLRALLEAYIGDLKAKKRFSAYEVGRHIEANVFTAFPGLADKPASAITPYDIGDILSKMRDRGVGRLTEKVRSYLRRAYQLGLAAEFGRGPSSIKRFGLAANPAAIIPADPEQNRRRTRTLSETELAHFLRALHNKKQSATKDLVLTALYLGGQRLVQLGRLRIVDVDLAGSEIKLYDPKGKRSQPREHVLPLTDLPHAIIERRMLLAQAKKQPWIFSATGKGPMTSTRISTFVNGSIVRSMVKEGTARESFQLRDIRRTCETLMAKMKLSDEIRGHVQSHGLGGVQNRHYNMYEYWTEKQEALARWETFLNELAAGHVIEAGRERAAA